MQIQPEIAFHNCEKVDWAEDQILDHIERLEGIYDRVIACRVRVDQRNDNANQDNGGDTGAAPAAAPADQGATDEGVSNFAPEESQPTSDAAVGSATAPIKLPNTGAGQPDDAAIATGLAALSAIAAAAAVAARRLRIAG